MVPPTAGHTRWPGPITARVTPHLPLTGLCSQAAPRVARPTLGPQSSPQNRQWAPVPGSTTPRPQGQGPASQSHIVWSSVTSCGNPPRGGCQVGRGLPYHLPGTPVLGGAGLPGPAGAAVTSTLHGRRRQGQSLSAQGRVLQALRCQRPAPHTACRRCGRPASRLCPGAAAGSATAAWAAWRPW